MKFIELGLDERLLKGIELAGFKDCTEVQEETFKHSLKGKDVLVQSQTGTGKTAAFLITIFQMLLTRDDFKNRKALILAPTRELVLQIEKESKILGTFTDLKTASFFGGIGYDKQEEALREGVDIVIATPGRLLDFSQSGKILFSDFSILVIDEADRMFDMGFYPDIKMILRKLPPSSRRLSMLFSATLSTRVKNLAWEFMNEAIEINMSGDQITVDKIRQALYHIGTNEKMKLLLGLLKKHNPGNVLIFANTKHEVVRIAASLTANGYNCNYIIGDLPQKKRMRIIEDIKSGKLKYLVATDVAARGLHIDDLDLVVNYDLPEDYENYVHRIGRTARAGKSGLAITLACEKYVYSLPYIESYIKMKIPVEWPEDDLLAEDLTTDEFVKNFISRSKSASPKRADTAKKKTKAIAKKEKTYIQDEKSQKSRPAAKKDIIKKTTKSKGTPVAKKQSSQKPIKKASLDDRMKYYQEKYGETFVVNKEIIPEKKKTSLIDKIFSIFKIKKG